MRRRIKIHSAAKKQQGQTVRQDIINPIAFFVRNGNLTFFIFHQLVLEFFDIIAEYLAGANIEHKMRPVRVTIQVIGFNFGIITLPEFVFFDVHVPFRFGSDHHQFIHVAVFGHDFKIGPGCFAALAQVTVDIVGQQENTYQHINPGKIKLRQAIATITAALVRVVVIFSIIVHRKKIFYLI